MKFQSNHVVNCFKIEELKKKDLVDFLPRITRDEKDQVILQNWKAYFKLRGIPWIVTLTNASPDVFTLWKKDERLNNTEVKREQRNADVNWFCESK